jgi:hypothetical protein
VVEEVREPEQDEQPVQDEEENVLEEIIEEEVEQANRAVN